MRIFRERQLEFRGHCANFMRFPSLDLASSPPNPPNPHTEEALSAYDPHNLVGGALVDEGVWCDILLTKKCHHVAWEQPATSVMTECLSGNICIIGPRVSHCPAE